MRKTCLAVNFIRVTDKIFDLVLELVKMDKNAHHNKLQQLTKRKRSYFIRNRNVF